MRVISEIKSETRSLYWALCCVVWKTSTNICFAGAFVPDLKDATNQLVFEYI